MVCEHLSHLEAEIMAQGIKETFRGQAWSKNCREWVYFDCFFDNQLLRRRLAFSACVVDHEHRGTHDGQESGFVCTECHDAIMGIHRAYIRDSTLIYK
jgi:hypothetical protein